MIRRGQSRTPSRLHRQHREESVSSGQPPRTALMNWSKAMNNPSIYVILASYTQGTGFPPTNCLCNHLRNSNLPETPHFLCIHIRQRLRYPRIANRRKRLLNRSNKSLSNTYLRTPTSTVGDDVQFHIAPHYHRNSPHMNLFPCTRCMIGYCRTDSWWASSARALRKSCPPQSARPDWSSSRPAAGR